MWKYAARLDDYAWHSGNAGWGAHPVGRKKPNGWGLYDMHGNVLKWCQDRYRPYRAEGAITSSEPGAGRIMRGGAWRYPPLGARSAHRYQLRPDYHNGYLGFRCLSAGPSPGSRGAAFDGQDDAAWRQLAYTP